MTRMVLTAMMIGVLAACGSGDPEPAATATTGDWQSSSVSGSDSAAAQPTVTTPAGEVIKLEVVSNDIARARGLMFRENLPADRGMLFLFATDDLHSFWMKNTLIALDMIWLAADGTVVHVERGVPPCKADPCPSYGPEVPSRHVLELAAGGAERYGIESGTKLSVQGIESYRIE